ncbi:nuclear transport factor 2 family protein [Magnetovibrio sp. PR-2]|uniref:nuclear transport factor 2 family protein n=1 Tax=Magnetovibrio sp. PR-2 TaxID=3120356 RepID=UPI002FCE256E
MKTENAKAYVHLFENLSPQTIAAMPGFVSLNVRFKDPFNDFTGIYKLRKLLQKTLSDIKNPSFIVTHQAWDGDVLFLRWTFQGHVRALGHWPITGMSEIHFDEEGQVCEHVDHWDGAEQFYERLPLIGGALGLIKRRLQL